MPGLVRKLVIFAAVDGLILQPLTQRGAPTLEINYNSRHIGRSRHAYSASQYENAVHLEAYGLVGVLNISTYSYLIAVSGREYVAQIFGKPIYLITDVAFIPISSKKDAENAIKAVAHTSKADHSEESLTREVVSDLVDDADNDALTSLDDTRLDESGTKESHSRSASTVQSPAGEQPPTSGVAQDVIGRKGAYGRFADSWFSRKGWAMGQRKNMGMSSHDDLPNLTSPTASRRTSEASPGPAASSSDLDANSGSLSPPLKPQSAVASLQAQLRGRIDKPGSIVDALLPKIVQTLKLLLLSRTFYFSYDYDITHRLARQHNSSSDMSLYKLCDPNHFWNSQLVTCFVEGNFDDFVLPVMQGFIGQRAFMMDEKPASPEGRGIANMEVADGSSGDPESVSTLVDVAIATKQTSFLLTLISRRSTKRAGFRYMRRGIDGNGYVANAVETEQILSSPQWTDQQVHSFTQTRGSIPLLYTQTPYTFKPAPILHGSKDANQRAFKTHFGHLANEYGQVQAVSLIDRHGPELTIGNAYEQHVDLLNTAGGLNSRPLLFEWFDFHNICRGMKFENVSILMDSLGSFLDTIGWTTRDNDGKLTSLQQGIVRTNCMDCLDRTNVVQSAIAQRILSNQLAQYLPATSSPMTADPTSEALNTLWADNGDAISLTYAGTAALKGDYVRTRRRNLAGVLTDFSLTLSRYYRNLFDDFFAQAVLDYALGNVNESIFTEFQERMTTADPAIDLAKARQSAITAAGNVVVEESEDLIGGWTLSAPAPIANPADATSTSSLPTSKVDTAALRAQPFREVLLLLSDVAIYSISYDWDSEKVLGYERVSLLQLRRLQVGTYITQTLTPSQKDARQNVGLLVEFEMDGKPHMMRTNTLTVGGTGATDVGIVESNDGERWVLAFKSLVRDVSSKRGEQEPRVSERELVKEVEREIVKAFERAQKDARGEHGSTLPGKSIREDGKKEEKRDEEPMNVSKAHASHQLRREEKDIVSLEEAQKNTAILEHIGYGLKRLVWG